MLFHRQPLISLGSQGTLKKLATLEHSPESPSSHSHRVSPAHAESGNRLSASADDTAALPRYELFPPSRWINARESLIAQEFFGVETPPAAKRRWNAWDATTRIPWAAEGVAMVSSSLRDEIVWRDGSAEADGWKPTTTFGPLRRTLRPSIRETSCWCAESPVSSSKVSPVEGASHVVQIGNRIPGELAGRVADDSRAVRAGSQDGDGKSSCLKCAASRPAWQRRWWAWIVSRFYCD